MIMKKIMFFASILCLGVWFTGCTDDIVIDNVDAEAYGNVQNTIVSIKDGKTMKSEVIVDMYADTSMNSIVAVLSKAGDSATEVKVEYDALYAEEYNAAHGTSFNLYPQEKVGMAGDGSITVPAGAIKSPGIALTLQPFDDTLEETYILPVKVTATSGSAAVSETSHLVYLVKNRSGQSRPRHADKKVIVWIEVNNTNPLNMLQFEDEEGNLLIDYVVLFAYNINYNREKGEIYVFSNPQCQYVLDHYDEMIKPLRDRGIKVIISILGNHDESGLAQLSDLGAREFAQKVAAMCNSYGFDGVNFDDEYSNSPDLSNPLFTRRSYAAGNRLYYETKKLLPDKEMVSYQYGAAVGNAPVDGVDPSEYMDIFNGDYGYAAEPYGNSTLSMCSYQSSEFAQWRYIPTESTVSKFVNSDYGFWMVFSLWNNQGVKRDWDAMNVLSEGMHGVSLKKPEYYYPETKSFATNPITW